MQGRERLIQCGIAVAPVTQWHQYGQSVIIHPCILTQLCSDSAYTERFMGMPTPESNWKGFTESSLTGVAEYLSDNSLLVVHGTADDNVHIEHSMMLSKTLVNNNILFRQQVCHYHIY